MANREFAAHARHKLTLYLPEGNDSDSTVAANGMALRTIRFLELLVRPPCPDCVAGHSDIAPDSSAFADSAWWRIDAHSEQITVCSASDVLAGILATTTIDGAAAYVFVPVSGAERKRLIATLQFELEESVFPEGMANAH